MDLGTVFVLVLLVLCFFTIILSSTSRQQSNLKSSHPDRDLTLQGQTQKAEKYLQPKIDQIKQAINKHYDQLVRSFLHDYAKTHLGGETLIIYGPIFFGYFSITSWGNVCYWYTTTNSGFHIQLTIRSDQWDEPIDQFEPDTLLITVTKDDQTELEFIDLHTKFTFNPYLHRLLQRF